MNKFKIFAFFLTMSSFSFSQNNSTLVNSNNGINVYKSNGVEGNAVKQSESLESKQLLISEYNITQCENAIQDINDKINHLIDEVGTEERILKYRNSIIILENRLDEIKLNK